MIELEDPADPRLDDYRDLRERDLARLRGAFVAEGAEVIARLARSPWTVRSVLAARSRVERLGAALSALPDDVPVFTLPLERMRELVGFDIHRGLLAAGARGTGPALGPVLEARRGAPFAALGLVGLSNTDNVGACFRNAAAFGARAVFLDATCADPLYRRALRVSMGHALRVPFAEVGSGRALVERLRAEALTPVALTPAPQGIDLGALGGSRRSPPERFALLVGAEGPGLPREVLDAVQLHLRIPMAGGTDSLNAATAAAVALFALRQASPSSFSA